MIAFWLLAFLLVADQVAFPAPLPKSTQEMVKKLKLDPNILADIDRELQVPADWIEKAKKEGKLRVLSPSQTKLLYTPFKERYPFIAVEYSGASREDRSVKTLVAHKSGRVLTDVLTGVGGTFYMFKQANALEDLRPIPAVKNSSEGAKDPHGLWVGADTRYWCMAYNTKLVKKEELPKRWEDLLANPLWRGGNLALGNRPNLWALQLWKAKGESWTKDFLAKLFTELKPQLRKEGNSARVQLLAAGEFHAVIPAAEFNTYQMVLNGAPVGFSCPEPVPVSVEETVILKGSPNIHAARLFINWLLSKEGQIAQFASSYTPPVHKDLMRPEFIPFAEQILGKEVSYRDPGLELEVLPKLTEFWNSLWLRGGRGR